VFPFLLLAQIAASPTRVAAPAPTPSAVVGTGSRSVSAAPRSLADVARERKQGNKGAEGGTLSVAGTSGPPAGAISGKSASPGASVSPARDRVRAAQAEVRAARRALDESVVRTGMTSEDAASKRARLIEARKKLAEAYDASASSKR
jgi:hypothetical protein